MTIEEAVKRINTTYQRVLYPGPCEGYEVRQLKIALDVLSKRLDEAIVIKFGRSGD